MNKNIVVKKEFDIINYQQKFIEYLDIEKNSIITYSKGIKKFIYYIEKNNIKNPKRDDIRNFKEYLILDHKPTTTSNYLIAVKQFFKWLECFGYYEDITKNIKGIKSEKRHLKLGLGEEEIKKVLNFCNDNKEKLIIKLTISIAGRCNEISNIRISDFYNDTGIIMLKLLGKGRGGIKQDIVKIDDRLYKFILEYIKEYNIKDYLFISNSNNNKNNKVTNKTIRLIIKNIFKRANMDNINLLSAHSLRHTAVEISLKKGLSIQETSESVRHKNINTTMIYVKELNKKESKFSSNLCDILF